MPTQTPVIICLRVSVLDATSAMDACATAKDAIANLIQVAIISVDESGSRPAVFGVTDISVMSAAVIGEGV